jgi:3-oxoadipate enol-lactonase
MANSSILLFSVCLFSILACKQPAERQSGYISIAGSKIYYETTGKGQPLLLLHGGFLNLHMWDQQISNLSKDFQVIACDLRGHGATIDDSTDYLMADGIKALLDTLHLKQCAVIGLSLGGATALEFAIAYPDYVSRLVLLGPGMNKWKDRPAEDSMLVKYDSLIWDAMDKKKDTVLAAEYFIRCWFDGPHRQPHQTDTAQRAKALAMAIKTAKEHQLKYWPKFPDTPTFSRVHELNMPVRIIVGAQDHAIIRVMADSLNARMKDVEIRKIEGTAHMPNMEKPEIVNGLIRSFLLPSAAMQVPPANRPQSSPLTPAPKPDGKPDLPVNP